MKRIFTGRIVLFCLVSPSPILAQVTLNPTPIRILGQTSAAIPNLNPNLVEGREFDLPEGIAIDTSTNPPALYVSDTANNRVLGFRNALSFANGQKADIVLGQPDFVTTLAQGPGRSLATGFADPTGIAVDAHGNVYIADAGNNRILRFPQPFAQTGSPAPDLVIGQTSLTGTANQGGVSAASLALIGSGGPFETYMAFDPSGNLWVADPGNNRVLRFNVAALTAQPPVQGPAADIVLGQSDFATGTYNPPGNTNALLSLTSFTTPSGIAFDAAGRLFVAESVSSQQGRILMWTPPFFVGEPASRILGIDTNNPPPPAVSEFQLAPATGNLFAIGNGIGVADTFNNRILIFPPVEQWQPGTTYQAAVEVAGQPDFSSGGANGGNTIAGPNGFTLPGAAVYAGNTLYVADSFNNRVLAMPQNGATFGPATSVLGQDAMNLNAPNLVEGREFDFGNGGVGFDAGIAIDLASDTPHVYVADTFNNRILGFRNLYALQTGMKADLVIGQPDFQQVLVNYPTNNPSQTNASGLSVPTGIAVDSAGNLWVADSGNGRVMRFPQPFANYNPGTPEQADLVLGQGGFTSPKVTDATDRTMSAPYGIAFTQFGGLLVSDSGLNRVLYFQGDPAHFVSGMAATNVFGQPDFFSSTPGNGINQMSAPHHIATDIDDRLYVADTGNGRVEIFNRAPTAGTDPPAAQILTTGLRAPVGIYVSLANGEIWVADPSAASAVRFPGFNTLAANNDAPNGGFIDTGGPLALTEDAAGDLIMADAAHRVGFYFAELALTNAANFLNQNLLAPGMIAAMFTQGNYNQFGGHPTNAPSLPLPTTLNGIQVLFNGSPAPIFYADPNQINFQVPMSAPQSGTAEVQVVQTATGRILGDTTVAMTAAVPGFFTQTGNGIGTAAALNQDNTVNSQDNPAAQGTVIQIFGTGQGFIPGGPPDGTAAGRQVKTPENPVVIMGAEFVPPANILYSGLAPTLVGVWQLNVLIPDFVITTPTFPTQVVALLSGVPSGGAGIGRFVQIYVKKK